MYLFTLTTVLVRGWTEPVFVPTDLARFRLVDMLTAFTLPVPLMHPGQLIPSAPMLTEYLAYYAVYSLPLVLSKQRNFCTCHL